MRAITVAAIGIITSSSLFAGVYSKYTADYYKADYTAFEGKLVNLKVAFLKPYKYKSDIPGVQFFHAVTYDDYKGVPGGEIPVAVPNGNVEELIRKYGTAPEKGSKSTSMTGILTADGHRLWFVDVNGSISSRVDARRQEVMDDKDKEKKHSESAEHMPADRKEKEASHEKEDKSEAKEKKADKEDNGEFRPTPPPGWKDKKANEDKKWWKVWD